MEVMRNYTLYDAWKQKLNIKSGAIEVELQKFLLQEPGLLSPGLCLPFDPDTPSQSSGRLKPSKGDATCYSSNLDKI